MSNAIYPDLPGLMLPVHRAVLPPPVQVRTAPSRREYRARDATLARVQYGLSYEFLRAGTEGTELATLVAFWLQHGGSFDSWLYQDPDDCAVTAQLFGTGNGATTAWQLVRSFGGFAEPVTALHGAPLIYASGVLLTSGVHYSISASGVVTFASAPAAAAPLTWTGNFYRRCRFIGDKLDTQKFMSHLFSAQKVEFLTVLGED